MRYLLMGRLLKTDTGQSVDMGLGNKFLNREKGRKKILALMNYYIGTNNVYYVDGVVEEKKKRRR